MNDTILKLASKTGLYVESGKIYQNRNDYPITEYMDKFADLIVKECWGPEFATLANIEYKPEHDKIVAMSCYTMCYYIADNFRDGEFRTEILKQFGVE